VCPTVLAVAYDGATVETASRRIRSARTPGFPTNPANAVRIDALSAGLGGRCASAGELVSATAAAMAYATVVEWGIT
jgi:hypothetical protein